MNLRKTALFALLILALAACRGGAVATATPTVAATAELPSVTPGPTNTRAPTQGAPQSTLPPTATRAPTDLIFPSATATGSPATETQTPTAGTPGSAATPGPTATSSGAAGANKAEFVSDVTVPDGAVFKPGESFVKTWKIKNAGAAAWTTGYALVPVRGDKMGAPDSVPLAAGAAPGATIDVSLTLTAPQKLGTYTSFWMLRTPSGSLFGIGPEANQPVYLQIIVAAAGATPQPTAPAGTINVTAASLAVATADFSGACPHTFTFTASFASEGAGDVTYQLEAESDKPGFVFTLPEPIKSTFTGAGPRTFNASYELQFTGSVSGRAWLHMLTPNDLQSDKVSFSLACQP